MSSTKETKPIKSTTEITPPAKIKKPKKKTADKPFKETPAVKKIKPLKAMKKTKAVPRRKEKPPAALPDPEKPAQTVLPKTSFKAAFQLLLHTRPAQFLMQGSWTFGKMGLTQFAACLQSVWKAFKEDDPYAEWTLVKTPPANSSELFTAGPALTSMIPLVLSDVPLTCINQAAQNYHLPAKLIMAVLTTEGGKTGLAKTNQNGTEDLGPMQINTVWLAVFKPYGVTKHQLLYHPCLNVNAGAWILAKAIAQSERLLTGIGNYHSHTLSYNHAYGRQIAARYIDLSRFLKSG